MTSPRPGELKLKHLFRPGTLGRIRIANRIKCGACCVSNYNTRDGFITARELARMKVIARTGCGIITNQGAYPDPLGEGKAYFRQIAIYDDKFLPQFEEIAGYIHGAGAIGIQQILHAGRYGGIDLGYCVQPSDVPQTLPHFRPPRMLTKDEIRAIVQQHADAAKRSVKAGFEGTEVTSFMGYLLATFNSKFTNQRTDEYGGSLENRGRFMRELIDAIKQATPDNPLIVRLNGAELMDRWGGNTEDECFELMQQAADCGVDMISVTVGWQEAPDSSIDRDIRPGHWNYLAARAKKILPNAPITYGVRLPDPRMADQCIADGEFDFWEVCRPLLADPELIHKAAEDRLDEARRCIGSLNCLSRLFRARRRRALHVSHPRAARRLRLRGLPRLARPCVHGCLPVIFTNPAGAPELACDECGCRWFDRMTNACYECGTPVPDAEQAAFREALAAFTARSGTANSTESGDC